MSALLAWSVSSDANLVDTISPLDVSSNERVVVVVVLTSPLDIMPKSSDEVVCVMTSPLAVWLMSPEAVMSTVSAVTVMDSVLRSPLAVSLTDMSWQSFPEKPGGQEQASSPVLSSM